MIGATVDLGRGLLIYTMLQGASRDMARQAVLEYYSGSNTLPPTCTTLATPCSLKGLTDGAHQLDPLGMSVVYQDSTAISSPPSYGTYTANANPLLTGSVEWQRNQLQQLADQVALDAAMKIGVGCSAGSANTVITEADTFLATQRTRSGTLSIGAGSCAGGYAGTDIFATGLSATYRYPYRAHQQQVEVTLTLSLPISFGNYMGASNTNVIRRAVAQQLNGDVAAISATSLACTGGQFNVAGSIATQNAISLSGGCAVYAHTRFDATSSTYSDLGNVAVYANGQTWVGGGGICVRGANAGSTNAVCADGYELSGHNAMTCGTTGTSAFLFVGGAAINPNPCAAGAGPQPVPPVSTRLPPEPNTDAPAIATLRNSAGGALGSACTSSGVYP